MSVDMKIVSMRSINRKWIFALRCHGRGEIGFVSAGASGEVGGSDNGSGRIPVRGALLTLLSVQLH